MALTQVEQLFSAEPFCRTSIRKSELPSTLRQQLNFTCHRTPRPAVGPTRRLRLAADLPLHPLTAGPVAVPAERRLELTDVLVGVNTVSWVKSDMTQPASHQHTAQHNTVGSEIVP